MTGTNHGMTGAVIALFVKEPLVAIPLAYASHFACDVIPHFGFSLKDAPAELFGKEFNRFLIGDFLLAVTLMVILGVLFPADRWRIWACMVAAACPDLTWAYYRLYQQKIKGRKPKLDPFTNFHHRIQWYQRPKGLYVEIAWFMAMGAIILTQR